MWEKNNITNCTLLETYNRKASSFKSSLAYTGYSTSIFIHFSRAYNSGTIHFWPHFGKAKMRLRGLHLFLLFVYNFQIKCAPLKCILALPMWVQKCIFSECITPCISIFALVTIVTILCKYTVCNSSIDGSLFPTVSVVTLIPFTNHIVWMFIHI